MGISGTGHDILNVNPHERCCNQDRLHLQKDREDSERASNTEGCEERGKEKAGAQLVTQ